jgi:hypothetical protein
LQRDGAPGSTNQHVGSEAETDGSVAAHAYIIASQRSSADMAVSRENLPKHPSASRDTDVETDASDRAGIDVLTGRFTGSKNASHILP